MPKYTDGAIEGGGGEFVLSRLEKGQTEVNTGLEKKLSIFIYSKLTQFSKRFLKSKNIRKKPSDTQNIWDLYTIF